MIIGKHYIPMIISGCKGGVLMTVYSICPSEKYGFFTSHRLDEMNLLVDKIKNNSFGRNSCIKNMEVNKKLGNICPIEISCLSVALDSKAKEILNLQNTRIPIEGNEEFEFVVPSVVDALDTQKSDISFFKENNNIKRINKYYFKIEQLRNIDLFIIPNCLTPVMCTDRFYDCCKQNKLTGISFKMIFRD